MRGNHQALLDFLSWFMRKFLRKLCYNRDIPKLFIDKTIEIKTPASKVWDRVLQQAKALAENEN
jgi:hypothetical protein